MAVILTLDTINTETQRILTKLMQGEVVTLYKPAHWVGSMHYYVIAEVRGDVTQALGFGEPSYTVGARDKAGKTIKLDFYNPEKGKEFVRSVVEVGWSEKKTPTTN